MMADRLSGRGQAVGLTIGRTHGPETCSRGTTTAIALETPSAISWKNKKESTQTLANIDIVRVKCQ